MKNAVILTGALRTIKKTIKYFKKNIIFNKSTNVFACVQNDTSQTDDEWTAWFKTQIGEDLISIEWFSLEKHPEWIVQRDSQLQKIQLDAGWKNYLRNSGSMIEYYQLQLAYMSMCNYEQKYGYNNKRLKKLHFVIYILI